MERYIQSRKNLGHQVLSYRSVLLLFDSFLSSSYPNCDYLSKEIFDAWLGTMVNNKGNTRRLKLSVVNGFCRYLNHIGVPCHIPRLLKYSRNDFVPYIFSHEQMTGILSFMDGLRMKQHNGNCHFFAMPALMRTLYSTGMRFSEATTLKNRNVDLENRTITLEITKNRQHRMIPINESLFNVLSQYVEAKSRITRLKHKDDDDLFFVSVLGGDMKAPTVHYYFKQALNACGIKRCPGRVGPRIHDIRHTFAVHSIMQQVECGTDMYCAMPILSIFLGHKDFRDTETYVRLTAEMYPDIMKKQKELIKDLFPKLTDYDD